MFTLTIYRHFIVWLLALFFPLGGFQDRSDPVWLMLLLSPAPVLGFWVVGVSVRCCLYGTVHVCVRKMGQWAWDREASPEMSLAYSRVEYLQKRSSHRVHSTNREIMLAGMRPFMVGYVAVAGSDPLSPLFWEGTGCDVGNRSCYLGAIILGEGEVFFQDEWFVVSEKVGFKEACGKRLAVGLLGVLIKISN